MIYSMNRINLRTRKQTPNGEPLFLISFRFPSCKSRKSCQNPISLTASFRLRLTGSIANRINREIREIRETEPCQVSFRLVRVFRVFRGKKSSWLRRGFGSAPQDWSTHGQNFLGGPSVCEALSRSHAVEKEYFDRIYRMNRINLRTRKQTPNGEPLFLISFRFPSCQSYQSCQNPVL